MANLFSSNKDDIIEDVYLEVMARMDDETLLNYCNTHPYNRMVCNMDSIWLPRINSIPGLSLLLPYRSHYRNLQDFYFNVRKDAHYVLMTYRAELTTGEEDHISAVGYDINSIFDRFNYYILYEPDDENFLCIAVRFNGVLDYHNITDYIIYAKDKALPDHENPQILEYPQLLERSYNTVISNIVPTQELLPLESRRSFRRTRGGLVNPSSRVSDLNTSTTKDEESLDSFNNPAIKGLTKVIAHPKISEPTVQFKNNIIDTFIEFDTASLRIAHKKKVNIKLFENIMDEERENLINHLIWIPYGYHVRHYYDRMTILLVDFNLLDLEPANYNFVLIDNLLGDKAFDYVLRGLDNITTRIEHHQEQQKAALTKVIMSDKTNILDLSAFDNVMRIIRDR